MDKNTKCCRLVDWMKIVAGYFYEKVLDDKIITEITRYQFFLLTGIEEDNNLCEECLKYKKEVLEPCFPSLKETLDEVRNKLNRS